MNNNNAWYASSTGSGVSLTIKGVLLAVVPAIIFLAKYFQIELSENEITQIVETASTAIASVMIVYGLIRKLVIKLGLGR